MNVFISLLSAPSSPLHVPGCDLCWEVTKKSAMVGIMAAAQETELERLENENRRLNDQVATQAWELSLLRARFARYETALRGSQVTVYTQDRDLRYMSISNSMLGRSAEAMLGRTDSEILAGDGAAPIMAVKREVLATGEAKRAEIPLEDARGIRCAAEPRGGEQPPRAVPRQGARLT